jgi:exopolysaccharide/PEP-CTERM locus tyrosine autokinase
MDLVEKAAQRLAQLQKAGVEVPAPDHEAPLPAMSSDPGVIPTPERFAQALERSQPAAESARERTPQAPPAPTLTPGGARTVAPLVPAPHAQTVTPAGPRSKTVHIDLEALAAAGFITPQAQRSQIADEFRVIKRPIIRNAHERIGARGERANLVMVTSAIPAEGKSFVALNLAMSIALEVDSTALLVDADVANPSLMQMTHLPPASKGLLDLLTNSDTKLADVLLKTNVDKLTLLPSGAAQGRATEMLASETMASLLEEMASRYADRILVFDSPPLLATTEARALASHMGQIVMVVEADRTPQAMVKHALETIESCPVVMMVLNKAPRPEVGSYYGQHYYSSAAAS